MFHVSTFKLLNELSLAFGFSFMHGTILKKVLAYH